MSIPPQAAQPPSSSYAPGELVSALMDGQLRGPLLVQTVHDSSRDPQSLKCWDHYHLIGEAMRSPHAKDASLFMGSPAFMARLRERLAEEIPPKADQPGFTPDEAGTALPSTSTRSEPAAKQPVFLWQALSAVASAAALAAVAWYLLLTVPEDPQWAQSAPQQLPAGLQSPMPALASPPGLEIVASPKGPMLRDAQLQDLLAAHKQASGNSALPVPAGFLRNATFEAGADASR